ncbi:MAG: hypothetical protein AAF581_06230 [Planctomycetota bacterium]
MRNSDPAPALPSRDAGVILCRVGFFLALICDILLSWYPFRVSSFSDAVAEIERGFLVGAGDDAAGHILLALLGVFLRLGFAQMAIRRHVLVIVSCFFAIEYGQAFVELRHFRGADLAVNSLSGGLGIVVGSWLLRMRVLPVLARYARPLWRVAAIVALATVVVIQSVPRTATQLRDWDDKQALQLLNEGSGNRTWLGVLDGVALYPRVFNPDEVAVLAMTSFREPGATERRRQRSAAVIYPFSGELGGELLLDRAGRLEPRPDLHEVALTAAGSALSALDAGGIAVAASTMLSTDGAVPELARTLTSADQFSIELRCAPLHLEQTGPARLITYSSHPHFRNFTVGQENDLLVFRVRNPANGRNGMRHQGEWPAAFSDLKVRHYLICYDRGWMTLFRDGVQFGSVQRIPWAPSFYGSPVPWNSVAITWPLFLCFGIGVWLGYRSGLAVVLLLWTAAIVATAMTALLMHQHLRTEPLLTGLPVALLACAVIRQLTVKTDQGHGAKVSQVSAEAASEPQFGNGAAGGKPLENR